MTSLKQSSRSSHLPLLEVEHLRVRLQTDRGVVTPVADVNFRLNEGEILGLVGESGSGKTLAMRALLGVLPTNGERSGDVRLRVLSADGSERAARTAMVFQEPLEALNPSMRVGALIAEAARARGVSRTEARKLAIKLLDEVGVPHPEERVRAWPHELSGGLRQRAMIAVALAAEPDVLFCDEPTTALDVTVQAQILRLLARLREDRGLSVVFVSHDLSVIAQLCERVAVMYAGRIVESGPLLEVIAKPTHPYTAALIAAAPAFTHRQPELFPIPGAPPHPGEITVGCSFAPRCTFAQPDCWSAAILPRASEHGTTECIRPRAPQGDFR